MASLEELHVMFIQTSLINNVGSELASVVLDQHHVEALCRVAFPGLSLGLRRSATPIADSTRSLALHLLAILFCIPS